MYDDGNHLLQMGKQPQSDMEEQKQCLATGFRLEIRGTSFTI